MAFFFKDLDAFITDLKDFEECLNVTITNEDGEEELQLIGLDGKPTDDKSVFGSRQIILYHFEQLYLAYLDSTDTPTIEGFQDNHSAALIKASANYRTCVEGFDNVNEKIHSEFVNLSEIKNMLMIGGFSQGEVAEKELKAKVIVNELYDWAYKLKMLYGAAVEQANTARLMCMITGYMEKGRVFFDETNYFEDTFTPCLDKMYKIFDSIRVKLKHNARCDSAKDMITICN